MIHLENVSKRYGRHVAVDQLNFTVKRGEVLGFLGPNGAGKSTTMNIITGYISATGGLSKSRRARYIGTAGRGKEKNRLFT